MLSCLKTFTCLSCFKSVYYILFKASPRLHNKSAFQCAEYMFLYIEYIIKLWYQHFRHNRTIATHRIAWQPVSAGDQKIAPCLSWDDTNKTGG